MRLYDLIVNGVRVMRGTKAEVQSFVNENVKPLGIEEQR